MRTRTPILSLFIGPTAASGGLFGWGWNEFGQSNVPKGNDFEATTADLAVNLLGEFTSASQAVIRIEQRRRLQKALDSLDPIEREIFVLRHFEQLTNGEASEALNLDKSATSNRYVRAMERLKGILTARTGCREDLAS